MDNKNIKDLELPKLPYEYNALEPTISKKIMELHHDKHHAAYLAKLKTAVEGKPETAMRLLDLFSNLKGLSDPVKMAVRNNGGGYWNHSFFWETMSPKSGGEPSGDLLKLIEKHFGSFDDLKKGFSATALSVFGSGWTWIVKNKDGSLAITSTPNQDNPLMDMSSVQGTPILGLDVWEHAYYLDYLNDRAAYIDAWWNVVNWDSVANRLN